MLFAQLSTNGSSSDPELGLNFGIEHLPCDVRDYEGDSRTAVDESMEAGSPAEHGRP